MIVGRKMITMRHIYYIHHLYERRLRCFLHLLAFLSGLSRDPPSYLDVEYRINKWRPLRLLQRLTQQSHQRVPDLNHNLGPQRILCGRPKRP